MWEEIFGFLDPTVMRRNTYSVLKPVHDVWQRQWQLRGCRCPSFQTGGDQPHVIQFSGNLLALVAENARFYPLSL